MLLNFLEVMFLFISLITSFGHRITRMMKITLDHTMDQSFILGTNIELFSMRIDSRQLKITKTAAKFSK